MSIAVVIYLIVIRLQRCRIDHGVVALAVVIPAEPQRYILSWRELSRQILTCTIALPCRRLPGTGLLKTARAQGSRLVRRIEILQCPCCGVLLRMFLSCFHQAADYFILRSLCNLLKQRGLDGSCPRRSPLDTDSEYARYRFRSSRLRGGERTWNHPGFLSFKQSLQRPSITRLIQVKRAHGLGA